MLFYEFQISCSPAEELPSGYGEERRKREERLSELNELLYALTVPFRTASTCVGL